MGATRDHSDTAATICALAERHKVAYTETATDLLGQHITRLAGDDVALDETELLLLALSGRAMSAIPTLCVFMRLIFAKPNREVRSIQRL